MKPRKFRWSCNSSCGVTGVEETQKACEAAARDHYKGCKKAPNQVPAPPPFPWGLPF